MKKTILTRSVQLNKIPIEAGSSGILYIEQDDVGGHIVSIPSGDKGFVDVGLNPRALTKVVWDRDDVRTIWTSTRITSDIPIANPSQITSLVVEITDTVSSKIRWNAPQGFAGSDSAKVDSYYIIVSTSPISSSGNYESSRLAIDPANPNIPESYIIPNLNSGQRYYVAVFSEKSAFGQIRRSPYSNVATFFTTPLDGNVEVPKRIPLDANKIYETMLHISFRPGKQFDDYPSFRRLAEQEYLIDNNGKPEGTPPRPVVAAYQSYGTLQPSWYNVGNYKVIFELDGVYDLDYLYMLVQNQNRFTIYTSGDGVNLIKAFDKQETPLQMNSWTKVPLAEIARSSVKYIVLALYVGDEWINGFVPYGTRKNVFEIKGEKYKMIPSTRSIVEAMGTNAFLAEKQYDWIGKISDITRLYNNSDWIMSDAYKQQQNQSSDPDLIEMVSSTSHMWNYNTKMQQMIDVGNKQLIFTLVSWPVYLRAPGSGSAGNIKPVDPGLDYLDLAITTNPQSYKHMARIAASMAYLWGSNPDAPEICNQFIDSAGQKGLNVIKYIELGNETDRTWHGWNGYFNPQEAAAFASALYDGHKGALGAGFGMKTADPNIKLVLPGLITINDSYVKEMMMWSDLYRGVGDYPWDVSNFHHYNAFRWYPDTPTWGGDPAYGVPPEQGNLIGDSRAFVRRRSLQAQNTEIWCSEYGYDEQYGGMHAPQDAPPTPEAAALRGRHKGIWILRSLMIYKSLTLDAVMHYWYAGDTVRVEDLNPEDIQREVFYTSGLVDGVTWAGDRNRKPLIPWWYVVSFLKALEGYEYTHTVIDAGVTKIVEDNIVLNYHPNLYAFAFKHKITNETVIVAWMGVSDWSEFDLQLRVSNDITFVPYTDFVNQDVRQSEDGVTTNVSTSIIEIGKSAIFRITETPSIIKTSLVGVGRLIAPTNIKIQSITSNSIKIAFTDENIGTNKTRVYQSSNPTTDFIIVEEEYRDSAETTITALLANTEYFFRIQFIDGARESEISAVIGATTLFFLEPPTELSQKDATSSTINLEWEFPTELENTIDEFVIYRSSTSNGEYNEVGRAAKTEREFRDIGLVANTQYYFMVRSAKDAVVSNFSFAVAASTEAPSLEPPTIQSAAVHSSGSYIELFFNEELKDEQTAINAFTILEIVLGGTIIAHPVTAISIGVDKTKIKLNFNITIFKSSSVTVSYNASLGFLKSVYDVPVNTFSSFPVTNNVLESMIAIIGWTQMQGITVNRNYLTATTTGRGVAQVKVPANASAIVQFNTVTEDAMILGLDQTPESEGFNTMDYHIAKRNGVISYKKVDSGGVTSTEFEVGIIRFRLDGTTIFFEVSYDNGLTFTAFTTSPQPPIDLYIKVYAYPTDTLLNVVGKGLTSNSDLIVPDPPSGLILDDDADTAEFTNSPGYETNDHEFSTNYLAINPTWTRCTTNIILLGDVNIPAGGLAIRVREATDRLPSLPIVSDVPFTGSISTNGKIMVQKSSGGTVLFGTNDLDELLTWLASALISEPITVQFNTSDVYYVPSAFSPVYNNGVHWVTFQGAAGVRPVFDNQRVGASVLRVNQNYTIFKNIDLRNADITNAGGCIIRADLRNNIKFLDMTWDYGFCGIRATTGCYNLEFDNIIVRNTREGSCRLGNATTIDQSNIVIRNIKLDDITNGGTIEGTSYIYYGGFALKVTDGLYIENVGALSGDRLYDLGLIETCRNATLKNARGLKIYSIVSSEVTFINCYLPGSNYLSETVGITILHSFMDLNISNCGKIHKLRGNIFKGQLGGTLRAGTDIPGIENNNLFIAGSSNNYMGFNFLDSTPNFGVDESNLATYKLTQGQNSLFVTYANRNTLNLNPYGSLRGNSVGKNLISAVIDGITDDTYGTPRTYPTDVGPFSGARPDVNDKPVPVTWIADNLARTLVASHILGPGEILISIEGGLWLPYTGVINVGDLAVPANKYRAKIKSAPYRDESEIAYSPAFTDAPDPGDYEVLRTIEIGFRGEFCSPALAANANDYWGTTAQIGSTTLSKALTDMTGAASGITISNFEKGFSGGACNSMPSGTYIKTGVRHAWTLNGNTAAKLKFTGLNDTLRYQFYLIAATPDENHAVKVTVNGIERIMITSLNYPIPDNGNIYSNPAVMRIDNLVSVGGELIFAFNRAGSAFQQVLVNYIVIEETNEDKPS